MKILEQPKRTDGHTYAPIITDQGPMTPKELAFAIGIKVPTLYDRLTDHAWDDPRILQPPVHGPQWGNGTKEWKKMSDRPRKENLNKIAPMGIGILEARYNSDLFLDPPLDDEV